MGSGVLQVAAGEDVEGRGEGEGGKGKKMEGKDDEIKKGREDKEG